MSRLNRLLQLMQVIRRLPPPVTAERLAAETGVSLRTIYRDIDTLRGSGAVIDGAAGYGFTMTEDPALPPMMFTDDEIDALVLGLREVHEIGDDVLSNSAGAALTKLRARLPPRHSARLENAVLCAKAFQARPVVTIDLHALRRATWDELAVDLDYVDANGQATSRRVLPLSTVYMESTQMLIAWCQTRDDFRAFRLDRIKALSVSAQSFRPQRVPLLRQYNDALKCGGAGAGCS